MLFSQDSKGHRNDLDIYSHETVSVSTTKSPILISKIKFSRKYVLYLTHLNSFRSKTEFTLFIDSRHRGLERKPPPWTLKWRSKKEMSDNTPHKFIALPGQMVQVSSENVSTHDKPSLTFYWIHYNFQHIKYLDNEPCYCDNNFLFLSLDDYYCLNYSFTNQKNKGNYYFIFFSKIL